MKKIIIALFAIVMFVVIGLELVTLVKILDYRQEMEYIKIDVK